jgi:hypothetical protein
MNGPGRVCTTLAGPDRNPTFLRKARVMAVVHAIPTSPRFENLTGRKFGRLTVESYAGMRGHNHFWNCLCRDGNRKVVQAGHLKSGAIRSCGCLLSETTRKRRTSHGASRPGQVTDEYKIWCGIIKRCCNKNDDAYERYGGRGITICERWRHDFAAFFADMGERPSPTLEIDRFPDNNGGYWCGNAQCSECGPLGRSLNCRWATLRQQARNKRDSRLVTHEGETLCLAEWEERTEIKHGTIRKRIELGWSIRDALTIPARPGNRYKTLTRTLFPR